MLLPLTSCGSANVVVGQPPTPTVTLSAPANRIAVGNNSLQFVATVQNAPDPSLTWQVNGVPSGNLTTGQVSAIGLYSAPATPPAGGSVTVTAALTSNTAISASVAISVIAVQTASGVFSWRNDLSISGVNSLETSLTPATVSNGQFGKLFSCPVDGYVYAQPLYYANLSLPALGTHNVVFIATEHDSVYAFDADASPCQTLWQASFINPVAGVTTVPSCPSSGTLPAICQNGNDVNEVNSNDIVPEIGITSTPVIDPASNTLYVVAATKEPPSATPAYFLRLHALNITTGAEQPSGPIAIQASVPGTGGGSAFVGGVSTVSFVPLLQNQRPGLQLSNGYLYIASASHGDQGLYHGWVLAYATAGLSPASTPIAFNDTPNGLQGGIWQTGAPPSFDSNGNLYVASGNGTFTSASTDPPNNFGDSAIKLSPAASGLTVVASFTPFEQALLDMDDIDIGSGGVLLLPDAAGTALHPQLATVVGKEGKLYIVDRNALGGFTPPTGPDNVVNTLLLNAGIFSTPAYFQGSLYVAANGLALQAYPMAFLAAGATSVAPTSQSAETFPFPGATPVISANGALDGIVWVLNTNGFSATGAASSAVLHAYDATNLATELYNSSVRASDVAGAAVKFTVPTVINGKVYVGSQTQLTVYGLQQ